MLHHHLEHPDRPHPARPALAATRPYEPGPLEAHLGDPPAADPVAAQLRAARLQAHHGPSATGPRSGTALCLSGGGFRAALFHLGALRRLDELGVLGSLRTISAVSGGAVVANLLTDPRLEWPDPARGGPVGGFQELVAAPLRALAGRNVRTPAMLSRLRPRRWWREEVAGSALADRLAAAVPWWGEDLREVRRGGPVVLTGATEVGYGVTWLFADAASVGPRGRVGDHRLGWSAPPPGLRIADAVAASCAHPPWFPPLELDGRRLGLVGGLVEPGEDPAVREGVLARLQLVDGGVYDNLGLEPVWSDHASVLVSDGGAVEQGRPAGSTVSRMWRLLAITSGGGKSTRLRWLHAAHAARLVGGATWSLGSSSAGDLPTAALAAIHRVRTDLDAFTTDEQGVLERHGYLVAEEALRRHAPGVARRHVPPRAPHDPVADPDAVLRSLQRSDRVTPLGRLSS